jgi:RNA-binding protein
MLSAKQRGRLAAIAQGRGCLASVGRAGATEALAGRLEELLARHELVKLRLAGEDGDARRELAEELAARTASELVRIIGKVAVLYKANPDPASRAIDLEE